MAIENNINDLGCANGWSEDGIEQRLVESAKSAGYTFKEEFRPPHTYVYTCEEAGLRYHTNCS